MGSLSKYFNFITVIVIVIVIVIIIVVVVIITVEPLLNGHPWGNEYWTLKRGWPSGRNNRKAIIETLIDDRLIEVAAY